MAVAVSVRLLIFILVWPLLSAAVFADDYGTIAVSHAKPPADIHLSGVLISPGGRSALINNKIAREGDRVAGAKIVSIGEGGVRMLMGSWETTVRVGSTAVWAESSGAIDKSYGPVRRGETLSEIAERHLVDNTTLNQLMIALFEANPAAFDKNINHLREGATLRIPAGESLRHSAVAKANAEVERHMILWRPGDQRPGVHKPTRPKQLADAVEPATYGPVKRGETLSAIAARLSSDGATLNQTITALFHANTDAFGGNMNVLHEGAILRIPEMSNQQTPGMAAAEVARHAAAWRRPSRPSQMVRLNHPLNPPIYDPGVLPIDRWQAIAYAQRE